MLSISDEVENTTSGDIVLTPYARLYRFGTPHTSGYAVIHEGLIGVPGDAGLKEITYKAVLEDGGGKSFDGKTGGWLGITDKYWAAAPDPSIRRLPMPAASAASPSVGGSQEVFWTDYQLGAVPAAAGATYKTEGSAARRRQAGGRDRRL